MVTIENIKKMYDAGMTAEVLRLADILLTTEMPEPKVIAETHAWMAWACYRQKEFAEARRQAEFANNELGLRCLAAIAAYVDKDPKKVKFYTDQLPESPEKDNALQIAARGENSRDTKEIVIARAKKWILQDLFDPSKTANLCNNTARYLLQKNEDLILALGFMELAINLYGDDPEINLHHRASAHYWKSIIIEKLFGKMAALPVAKISIILWEKQVVADPNNENFKKSLEGARKRLDELNQ